MEEISRLSVSSGIMLPHLNAFPNTIVQAGFLAGIMTGHTLPIAFSIAALVNEEINAPLKRVFRWLQPRNADWKRPLNMPATGCGSFARCASSQGEGPGLLPRGRRPQGMPSGHTQAVTFAAAFWTAWLLEHRKEPIIPIIVVWALAAAVGLSRITQHCHTLGQVLVGGLIGSSLGYGTYAAFKRLNLS